MGNELDAQVRALYAGAQDRFVDERNALATRLKEAGDSESAKRIKDQKKPTVAAWAVDQLTSRDEATLEELFDAGRKLVTAQRQISTPGGAERMREIAETRRRLVDQLVRTAGRALSDAGMPGARTTLDKVTNTLMAIATDESAADRVRVGILDKELPAPAGFGHERLDTALLASVTELPSRAGSRRAEPNAAERCATERLERLDAKAKRLAKEADELEREADRIRQAAEAKSRQAREARKRAEAALSRADEARKS